MNEMPERKKIDSMIRKKELEIEELKQTKIDKIKEKQEIENEIDET